MRWTVWIGVPALVLAGFMAGSVPIRAAETGDSEQVSKLLAEAKTMAYQLKLDAQDMETFTRADVSWASHKVAINQIREHVNELGRQVSKLQAAEGNAAPWQRTAITRIVPYLEELAGYTAAVIEHVNGDVRHTPAEYKDYLEANADYASDLSAMIAQFVDYGKSKNNAERLGEKLEIPVP